MGNAESLQSSVSLLHRGRTPQTHLCRKILIGSQFRFEGIEMREIDEFAMQQVTVLPYRPIAPSDFTRFRRQEAAENPQQTGFASPVRARDLDQLARLHDEGHAAEQMAVSPPQLDGPGLEQ